MTQENSAGAAASPVDPEPVVELIGGETVSVRKLHDEDWEEPGQKPGKLRQEDFTFNPPFLPISCASLRPDISELPPSLWLPLEEAAA